MNYKIVYLKNSITLKNTQINIIFCFNIVFSEFWKISRGKTLNEFEKGQITAFRELGLSGRQISKKLGRPRSVVQHFMNGETNYGSQKSPGRLKFLSKRDERQVIRVASQRKLTA